MRGLFVYKGLRIITESGERKILDVNSETFEQAKKRILRYYPNTKSMVLIDNSITKARSKKK